LEEERIAYREVEKGLYDGFSLNVQNTSFAVPERLTVALSNNSILQTMNV